MSDSPLLLPREVGVIVIGVAALVAGLVSGRATPTFSHPGTVEKAELEIAKNIHELLPDSFRVEATIKKTGLTLLQSEDILLLGGDAKDAGCSGGALFLYWMDGAFGFGCQCNGPSDAGCPTGTACSDPAIIGPSKFKPNTEYVVSAAYSRTTEIATLMVDGELYLSKHVHWSPPRSGPVTLLAGSHTSADTEPFLGEARNIGVWPLPAGSWGWDTIGIVAGMIGAYIGLGAAIGRRTYQRSGSLLEVHPHAQHWASLSGMVADGMNWTLRRSKGPSRGPYSKLHAARSKKRVPAVRADDYPDVDRTSDKIKNANGEESIDSTAAGAGPAAMAEVVPAQTVVRGLLSSGARETGAKVKRWSTHQEKFYAKYRSNVANLASMLEDCENVSIARGSETHTSEVALLQLRDGALVGVTCFVRR